jgi:thiamine-phosphate diphosphorylase
VTPPPDLGRESAAHPRGRAPEALTAHRLLVITDRFQAGARGVPRVVAAAVEGGARWVLLRDRDLPVPERAALAAELGAILADCGGRLSVAGTDHLGAAEPVPAARPPWLGRSCHSAAELARAAGEGCDYAVMSPVFDTPSKPGYGPALGLGRLAELCAAATLPVYALGGVDPDRARPCREAGAAGVAVMGAVMRATHPERVVADLLDRTDGPCVQATQAGLGARATQAGLGVRATQAGLGVQATQDEVAP